MWAIFFLFLGDSFRQQRKPTKQDILFGWGQTAGALRLLLCYTKRRWLKELSPSCLNGSLSKVDQQLDSFFLLILIAETNTTVVQFALLAGVDVVLYSTTLAYRPVVNCVNKTVYCMINLNHRITHLFLQFMKLNFCECWHWYDMSDLRVW